MRSKWMSRTACVVSGCSLTSVLQAPRRYFARLGRGAISVYETPEMGLLDKRSLKLEGVQDFAWSPAAPLLCAYQAEGAGGNLPARVSLIRIPDRVELRQKNLFSVSGAPCWAVGARSHVWRVHWYCSRACASILRRCAHWLHSAAGRSGSVCWARASGTKTDCGCVRV